MSPPGGPEPDDPVPVLTLTSGSGEGATTPTTRGDERGEAERRRQRETIAIIGIIVGASGLLVGIGALVSGRRKTCDVTIGS
jgi:hypothetical protein